MKAILISINPKWVAKILNGEKTIEIRKKFPKGYVGWVYIYCTKGKPNLIFDQDYDDKTHAWKKGKYIFVDYNDTYSLNDKVVARFWCDKVEEIEPFEEYKSPFGMAYKLTKDKIIGCQKAQLTYDEYNHYLKGKNGKAIHITKLEIFDRPKEIKDFLVYSHTVDGIGFKGEPKSFQVLKPLTKAPQSWCYVEV